MTKKFPPTIIQEAALVFLIVMIGYGYFSFGPDWNVNSRLTLVKAFVEEGRFEIDSYHQTEELNTNDTSYFNGHYYSNKAIGTSLLGVFAYYPVYRMYQYNDMVPATRLFREWLTFLVVSLPTAILAPLLYILIRQITASASRALLITLSISLGTPLYKYGTAFYGHALVAMLFFLAFLIWFYARRRRSISLPLAFLASLLLGLMVITEYPTIVLVLMLGFYMLYTLHQSQQLSNWKVYGVMGAGFLLPMGLQLYYNTAIFGVPFATAYSYQSVEAFRNAHTTGLLGFGLPNVPVAFYQTFHPSFGMFWQSPILFLSWVGWFFMWKNEKYRPELYFTLGVIVLFILFFSGFHGSSLGGLVFVPRYLIPILPLFALPLAFVPESLSIPLFIMGIVSLFQNFVMAATGFEGLVSFFQRVNQTGRFQYKGMVVYEVCLPNLIHDQLTDNRGMEFLHLQGALSLLPLFFSELILLAAYLKLRLTQRGLL